MANSFGITSPLQTRLKYIIYRKNNVLDMSNKHPHGIITKTGDISLITLFNSIFSKGVKM